MSAIRAIVSVPPRTGPPAGALGDEVTAAAAPATARAATAATTYAAPRARSLFISKSSSLDRSLGLVDVLEAVLALRVRREADDVLRGRVQPRHVDDVDKRRAVLVENALDVAVDSVPALGV